MALLKALVVAMAVLIVGGLVVIGYTVANRTTDGTRPPAATEPGAAPYAARLALPAGSRVVASHVDGGRLVVQLVLADGSTRLAVFDLASGRAIGTVDLGEGGSTPPQPPRP